MWRQGGRNSSWRAAGTHCCQLRTSPGSSTWATARTTHYQGNPHQRAGQAQDENRCLVMSRRNCEGGCLAKCVSQRLSPLPCSKRGQRFLKTPRGSNYLFKNSFHTFRFRQCLTFSFSPLPALPGSFCSLRHLFTVHRSACSKFHSLLIGALKCFF